MVLMYPKVFSWVGIEEEKAPASHSSISTAWVKLSMLTTNTHSLFRFWALRGKMTWKECVNICFKYVSRRPSASQCRAARQWRSWRTACSHGWILCQNLTLYRQGVPKKYPPHNSPKIGTMTKRCMCFEKLHEHHMRRVHFHYQEVEKKLINI